MDPLGPRRRLLLGHQCLADQLRDVERHQPERRVDQPAAAGPHHRHPPLERQRPAQPLPRSLL